MSSPKNLLPSPTTERFSNQVSHWEDSFDMAFAADYGDPLEEYRALRESVVALEYSTIRKWFVEGPDAVQAVDSVFSRDVAGLSVGRVAYGVVVDEDGFMIEDVTVLKADDQTVVMFGGDPLTEQQLRKFLVPGTSLTDRRAEIAAVSLQGPKSRALLERLTDADVSNEKLPYYGALTGVTVAGVRATILRLGFTAELGFEIMVDLEDADRLWDLILAQTDLGIQMMGLTAILVARTEAGFVMGGFEYDRKTLPFECGLGWALDFEKGSFQGKNALLAKRDLAETRLVSVVIDAHETDVIGTALFDEETEVGWTTMIVTSPELGGKTIGLARVQKRFAKAGTYLSIPSHPGLARVEVVSTPIHDPERLKVRS